MAIRSLRGPSARAAVTPVADPGAMRRRRKDPGGTPSGAKSGGAETGTEAKRVRHAPDSRDVAEQEAQPDERGTDITV